MSRMRFTTARDVFDAFPAARDDIDAEPTDDGPLAYLRTLMDSETPEDAVAFCAYLLPRRESVWWACQCVRSLNSPRKPPEEDALAAAESWVREPEEEHRQRALQLGTLNERSAPTTWLALAAAWSGGSMMLEDQPVVLSPAHLTAKAVRAAVLTALARIPVKQRRDRMNDCLEQGLRLAKGDSGQSRQ